MENNLQQLGNQATQAIQNQYPSLQLLRDALVKKFNTENPLIRKRDAAIKDFLAAPEEIADKYAQPIDTKALDNQFVAPGQNPVGTPLSTLPIPTGQPTQTIWRSPSEQRARYSRELVNKFVPVMTLNDLLMLQGGGVESILSQANEGIKSDIEAKKLKYSNALDLLKIKQEYGGLGSKEDRKRTIEATDEAMTAMQEWITQKMGAKDPRDKKTLIWTWINANEPFFASQGIDTNKLWDIYNKAPAKLTPETPIKKSQGLWGMLFGGNK